jgi:7-keto-8-aminopelargonate synthetase-like enzyme
MAFAYTVTSREWISRRKRIVWGTFTNAIADTGGAIVTGMKTVDFFIPSINSHVNDTCIKHTVSGGTVTIDCDYDCDGTWLALGT